MKKIYIIFFLALYASVGIIVPMNICPENTEIVSDLDDVLLQPSLMCKINIVVGGIWRDPLNAPSYIQALIDLKKKYTADADGIKEVLHDQNKHSINGLTFHFLHHGMRDPRLTKHAAAIVTTIERSHTYIEGTKKIYHYLKKEKGYSISFATNKDRISYNIAADKLGSEFTGLATNVFVAHKANHETTITALQQFGENKGGGICITDYTQMLNKAIHIQPSNTIHHVPVPKPHLDYYAHVHQKIGPTKNIIFIDDKQSNIDGFQKLQNSTQVRLCGIHFKNPTQLVDEFIKLGILSEETDKKLLEEIRYPGISGKIKRFLQQLLGAINLFFPGTDSYTKNI